MDLPIEHGGSFHRFFKRLPGRVAISNQTWQARGYPTWKMGDFSWDLLNRIVGSEWDYHGMIISYIYIHI